MKVYVASSWRNERQPAVVKALRAAGHDVYVFKSPDSAHPTFHWSDIDPKWLHWDEDDLMRGLGHRIAEEAYKSDFDAMEWADTCVLVMPCGRSAHLEAGWFVGKGKGCAILLDGGEPELMQKMATLHTSIDDVIAAIANVDVRREEEATQ